MSKVIQFPPTERETEVAFLLAMLACSNRNAASLAGHLLYCFHRGEPLNDMACAAFADGMGLNRSQLRRAIQQLIEREVLFTDAGRYEFNWPALIKKARVFEALGEESARIDAEGLDYPKSLSDRYKAMHAMMPCHSSLWRKRAA
jgi:hypothetical protein